MLHELLRTGANRGIWKGHMLLGALCSETAYLVCSTHDCDLIVLSDGDRPHLQS